MGNHGVAGARAHAATAGNRAKKPTNVNPGGPRSRNLSNWPVSRRLFAVIVLALVMGLGFGGLRIASAESSASQFGRVSQLATLGQRLSVLIQDLQNERDQTLSLLVTGTPALDAQRMDPLYARTNGAAAAVKGAAAGIGSGFPANIQGDVSTVDADINRIQGTGASTEGTLHNTLNPKSPEDEFAVIDNYGAVTGDMIALADQVAQGVSDASLTSDVRAFNALALAKEQLSQQRALLNYSFSNPNGDAAQNVMVDPNTELALQIDSESELSDESGFQQAATPAEQAFLITALGANGSAKTVSAAEELETNVIANEGTVTNVPGSPLALSIADAEDYAGNPTPKVLAQFLAHGQRTWDTGTGNDINAMQATETMIADNIASRAGQLHSGAQQSALITGAVTVAVLLLVLVAALLVARSLVNPLRRLRVGALNVASVQLPERVRQLSESPEAAGAFDVAPIDVLTEDEIGQVARAFDQVHQEAVRLAGEEALLRTSFNAMFVNLSRRSQSLQERLARMIDSLEQNEDDPGRLSNLFSMDHLVTRMRRNSENLLLLAGHEGARKWSEPAALADVARAAASEIEQYNRVVLNIQPGVLVIGQAVFDVVHLLAELIENATLYSPKDTQVQVSAQELSSSGVLIEVTDKGIGISEARLTEMNWRLDNPPTMDVSVSRHMGLFAVARLAERHRVRVRLRPAPPQGLTALVWLPDSVIERTNRAVYDTTGDWQSPVGQPLGAPQGGFQARRSPGQFANSQLGALQQSQRGVTLTGPGAGAGAAQATSQEPTLNWFRNRRTTSDAWTGSWPAGRNPADIVAEPSRGKETAAGLPMRVPKANLIPGSAAGAAPGGGNSQGARDAGSSQEAQTLSQRSPDMARSRLSGFQRGARRAEGQDRAREREQDVELHTPAGPELAGQRLHCTSRGRRARGCRIRGRRAPCRLRRHPRRIRRTARGHHLWPCQPAAGRRADLRGGHAHAGAGGDAGRADARQVDQRRVQPVRSRRTRMRHGPGLLRDVTAGGSGRRGAVAGAARRRPAKRIPEVLSRS
jgi:signal transduction histidine kinase